MSDPREIPLTGKLVALVDAADFAELSQWSWYPRRLHGGRYIYAVRVSGGVGRMIFLHRWIMQAGPGQRVSFASGDKLDCRRANLICRIAPPSPAWKLREAQRYRDRIKAARLSGGIPHDF